MAAPKGNRFWLKRAKHGRDTIFSTPQLLWEACLEYFEYENKQFWDNNEAIKAGEFSGQLVKVPVKLPFTIQGLCIFIDTNTKYFAHFEETIRKHLEDKEISTEDKEKWDDFSNVVTRVKNILDKQKIDGAMAGAYPPMLVGKIVGLVDKTETVLTGRDGGAIQTNSVLTVEVLKTGQGISGSELEVQAAIDRELNASL